MKTLSLAIKKLLTKSPIQCWLTKHDSNYDVSDFLDTMHSNLLLPRIISPARITAKSSTLIDNIFSIFFDSSFTSGNIVTALSDHHVQFLVIANQANIEFEKPHHLYQDFSQFEKKNCNQKSTWKYWLE